MSAFTYSAPDLDVVFFAEAVIDNLEQAQEFCREADLVVALGNVDLEVLAALLESQKPALAVLGSKDAETPPPPPFRWLHGGGVTFKEWRVAGLSGGKRLGPGGGYYLDEDDARGLLAQMPACDLLLTHTPPAGLPSQRQGRGFAAVAEYIAEHNPIYAFYAHAGNEHVDDVIEDTWVVGVSGLLYPPPLRFV